MKKIIAWGMLLWSLIISAQNTIYTDKNSPLVVVENQFSTLATFKVNPDHIKSINVVKAENAISQYGEKAKNGALEITLKDEVQLLTLEALFNQYHLSEEDKKLPIVLNKRFVNEKEHWLIDASIVSSVQVLEEQPFVEPVLLPRGKAIYIKITE